MNHRKLDQIFRLEHARTCVMAAHNRKPFTVPVVRVCVNGDVRVDSVTGPMTLRMDQLRAATAAVRSLGISAADAASAFGRLARQVREMDGIKWPNS